MPAQIVALDGQRTCVIAPRSRERLSVRDVVQLSLDSPEKFREEWIVYREDGGDRALVVSKSVFQLGFLESVLDDIRAGRGETVEGTLIVRWSERTAEFAKKDGSSTFFYELRRNVTAGLPMVLFPRVVAMTDGSPAARVSLHDGLDQREVRRRLDEYSRRLRNVEAQEDDLLDRQGYEVVLPRRAVTVEDELATIDFVQRGLRAVIESERRKWYEGIEPVLREAMARSPEMSSLPRGLVPIEEIPKEYRDSIESSLRLQAQSRGETFVLTPGLRVRFVIGIGAALPLPMSGDTPRNQVIQLPFRD